MVFLCSSGIYSLLRHDQGSAILSCCHCSGYYMDYFVLYCFCSVEICQRTTHGHASLDIAISCWHDTLRMLLVHSKQCGRSLHMARVSKLYRDLFFLKVERYASMPSISYSTIAVGVYIACAIICFVSPFLYCYLPTYRAKSKQCPSVKRICFWSLALSFPISIPLMCCASCAEFIVCRGKNTWLLSFYRFCFYDVIPCSFIGILSCCAVASTGLPLILTVVLVSLRLDNVIAIPFVWALAPTWFGCGVFFIFWIIFGFLLCLLVLSFLMFCLLICFFCA